MSCVPWYSDTVDENHCYILFLYITIHLLNRAYWFGVLFQHWCGASLEVWVTALRYLQNE